MEYLVTSQEMKRYDKNTIENLHMPELVLMERAALGIYNNILELECLQDVSKPILLLCGYGNNGGDGLAVARLLLADGYKPIVVMIGDEAKSTESNQVQQSILNAYAVDIIHISLDELQEACICDLAELIRKSSCIIDALFGVGLNRPLDDKYSGLFDIINGSQITVCSIDVPSGINLNCNRIDGPVIKADITYELGFVKAATIIYPLASYCGRVVKVKMGIDEFSICDGGPSYYTAYNINNLPYPSRYKDANKGTYKKLLIIAGSKDIYGAAYLATAASFASGIGMAMVITHENNRKAINETVPEAMTRFYDEETTDEEVDCLLRQCLDWADGVLIGPGIGTSGIGYKLLEFVVNKSDKPLVLDADAIKLLKDNNEKLLLNPGFTRQIILTPHVGEFSYLTDISVAQIKEDFLILPKEVADKLHVTIVCKDARSIVSSHYRETSYINSVGNDGMASAGSGDVLAGICAVFLLQMGDAHNAAALAAFVHGAAGDLASVKYGSRSMQASNIIEMIPEVFLTIDNSEV